MSPGLPLALAAWAASSSKWQLHHPGGSPYLTRWVLAGCDALETHDPGTPYSAFLHELHTADGDRHPHNHPWRWAASLILAGGYAEKRVDREGLTYVRMHDVGDLSILEPGEYHSITSVQPGTLTLFFVGRETHDWGFLVDGRHVPHAQYFARDDVQRMTTTRLR